MKKKGFKRFKGMSPMIVDEDGKLMEFFTTAPNEGKGTRALRHKMNKERKCVPEAIIPGMEITEIAEVPKPHAP